VRKPKAGKPRVLLTGGTGLLALNWACAVRETWDVVLGTHRHRVTLAGVSSSPISLRSAGDVGEELDRLAPDLVVHTAGLADVDRCEADPALAREANALLARNVAVASASRSIRLVHISTDHLFTGSRPLVSEAVPPQPLNEYGRSKQLAEQWVLDACPDALVIRTNFFGWGHATRQSFSDWIIQSLRAGRTLSAFADVHFTPILADRLALWVHELSARGATGTFNVCGDERVSKHEFALRLVAQFGLPPLVRRSSIDDAALRAPRPRDMSLDNTKARQALGRTTGRLEDDLLELKRQETSGRREEQLRAVST
jgi:dTDP-4-dehydrorhamnose reductase